MCLPFLRGGKKQAPNQFEGEKEGGRRPRVHVAFRGSVIIDRDREHANSLGTC